MLIQITFYIFQKSIIQFIPKEYLKINKILTDYDHFDFIYGINAVTDIYKEIIQTAFKHNQNIQKNKDV